MPLVRVTLFASSTIAETSSFDAIGGLKWEDIVVPSDNWTDQIVASTT